MIPREVRAPNPGLFTLDGTRTFLLGRDEVAVVDPGPDVEAHVRALVSSLGPASWVTILVTHDHPDHAGGALELAGALGSRGRLMGATRGAAPLFEGDRVSTDEGELLVLETPGHARPHLSFLHGRTGTLFCGDLLLGQGDTTWVGEYPEAVTDYLASLRRLQGIGLRRILPAHGPPIEDPEGALARFAEHRAARIRQVEEALAALPGGGPGELVDHVYGAVLPQRLRQAALLSVRATLHHLGVTTEGVWGTEPAG